MKLAECAPETWAASLAVVDGELRWTWGELDRETDRVVGLLQQHGVAAGDRVALLADRSALTIAALRGVLRAGAIAVPMEPHGPLLRQVAILEDAAPKVVLVGKRAARRSKAVQRRVTAPFVPLDGASAAGRSAPVAGSDPALILYTSGSTGRPKGVVLAHEAVGCFARWAADTLELTAKDRVAHLSPLTFDLCTLELFAAAEVGAAVVVIPPVATMFPATLAEVLTAQHCSVVYTVPSVWMRLQSAALAPLSKGPLRHIVYAGEPFPPAALSKLMADLPGRVVHNFFGPTETNVCAAHRVLSPPLNAVPIGFPPDYYRISVRPDGELWVSGLGVMQGYWRRPELNAEVFVEEGGHLWLKTGDRVRRDPDGTLHALGRRDTMLKLHGFRVQPEEGEQALSAHPGIHAARVGLDAEGVLMAEVEVASGDVPADLSRHLARRLPRHMVPARVDVVDALPRTPRGKLDRAKPLEAAVR